jgi:DNA-binding transcriptional LysR family regulator
VSLIEAERLQVNLRLLPLTTRDPRRLLEGGDADLAVGYFPELVTTIVAQGPDSHLHHARLYDTRYVCVMRKGHPLAKRALTLDDYVQANHLLVSFSGRPRGYVDQALAAVGRQRRVLLAVNQFFAAGRVVARSDLLTVLPEGFIEATGYSQELVTRELPLTLDPVHVEMIWHLRHEADPAHGWLRGAVVAVTKAAAA